MSDGVIDSTYTIIAVSDELVQNTYQVISSNTEYVSKLTEDDVRNLLGIIANILNEYVRNENITNIVTLESANW